MPVTGPSAACRTDDIALRGGSTTAPGRYRHWRDEGWSTVIAAGADADYRGAPPRRRRPRDHRRSGSCGYVDAGAAPPTWRIACRNTTRRRSSCRRRAGLRPPAWTDRTTTAAASGPGTITPSPARTSDDHTACNRWDSYPRSS